MSTLPTVEEQLDPACACGACGVLPSEAQADASLRCVRWTDASLHHCICSGWHPEHNYAIDTACKAHEHMLHPERFADTYCAKHQLWREANGGCWGCAMEGFVPEPRDAGFKLPSDMEQRRDDFERAALESAVQAVYDAQPTALALILEAERLKMEHMREAMQVVQAELGALVVQWCKEHPQEAERMQRALRRDHDVALELSHGSGHELRASDPEVIAREYQGTYLHAADVMPPCTSECAPHGVCYRGHR